MTVNVGIIGLGIMGADHANIIQSKVSNAKVTSVYDKNINQAQKIIETLDNPEIHNSGLELINSNKVDAVMVVSPDDSHVEFVLERWLLRVKYLESQRLVGRGDITYDNDRSYS